MHMKNILYWADAAAPVPMCKSGSVLMGLKLWSCTYRTQTKMILTELGLREFSESRFPNPVFSNLVFRIRLSKPNPVFRIRLSGSNPVFRIRLPGPNPIFQILFPFSESRFGIPFSESDCSGRISFSESDCLGRFRQWIKTRNCRVEWTDARSEFIYKICKPWQNEAHCTWFNGRKNIYAMNNMVILDH